MFKRNHGDYYSFSQMPLIYLAAAGFAGLAFLFGNDEFESFFTPVIELFPTTWPFILGTVSTVLLTFGLIRKGYVIHAGGSIKTTLYLLWILPYSHGEIPLSQLRHIDISYETGRDRRRNIRESYYVLRLVFENFKRIEIARSTCREDIVKEAEFIQRLTGKRLG